MTPEQAEVLMIFNDLLRSVTADGGRKRAAGLKPSWKIDESHEAAIFSHLNKWKHGEKVDPDSGVHPLVHLAWRALAVAWQESNNDEVEAVRVAAESPLCRICAHRHPKGIYCGSAWNDTENRYVAAGRCMCRA